MNRHERRRNAVMARHNRFVADYVHHLPEVSPDAAPEPGRVFTTFSTTTTGAVFTTGTKRHIFVSDSTSKGLYDQESK
jgi:hypothetical protein